MKYAIVESKTRKASHDWECLTCQLKRVEPAGRIILKGEKYQAIKCLAMRGIGCTYPVYRFHIGHAPKPETVLQLAEIETRKRQRLTKKTIVAESKPAPQGPGAIRRAFDAFRDAHLF